VDDEELLVEMADDMLSALGYKVKSLTDPMKALQLITLDPYLFDLVITDQAMPKITGRLLTRRIKEIRPDLPIILCTGYSEQISQETEETEGIAEFVMKPLSKREMAETVRRVLDRTQPG
jgi:CheY-like chemotaxis protein